MLWYNAAQNIVCYVIQLCALTLFVLYILVSVLWRRRSVFFVVHNLKQNISI